MKIKNINVLGNTYRLFELNINGKLICVAEEKLEDFIQSCIDNEKYHFVENIDEMYEIYIPQEIADTENEKDIILSVLDII